MRSTTLCTILLTCCAPTLRGDEGEAKAVKLVEQLASASFRIREVASRELVLLGADSKKALELGCRSADAEVADRCRKLLPLAYAHFVQKVLDDYLANPTGVLPGELPCAERWVRLVGNSKESTAVYLDMLKSHRAVLLEVAEKPNSATEVYRKFGQDFYQILRPTPNERLPSSGLSDADMALCMFLATDPNLNRTVADSGPHGHLPVYYLLNQNKWGALLAKIDGSPVFRKLFGEFVGTQTNMQIQRRALQLAVTWEVTEVIPSAVRLAKDKTTLSSIRGYALTAIGRLGTKENLADLRPLLDDATVIANVRLNDTQKIVETRDVALGVSLLLCGQTMTEFGFDRDPPTHVSTSGVGAFVYYAFSSPERRDEAMKRWKEYADKEKLFK